MPNHALRLAGLVCGLLAGSDALAAKTAFRLNDLDLRDPHIYISYLACFDETDTSPPPQFGSPFNPALQSRIQTDGDSDGDLDLSLLLIFDPVDPTGSGGILTFGEADCAAPMAGTSCQPNPLITPVSMPYHNQLVSSCLGIFAGSTYAPYSPEIVLPGASPGSPCFKTDEATMTLRVFGDVSIPFSRVSIGAKYVGTPTTNLNNGLIRGFLSKEDADAVIITIPTLGDQPLSSLLPGTVGNCAAHTDADTLRGSEGCITNTGWWWYLNFNAVAVPFTETPTRVDESTTRGLWLDDAIPNPFNPSATIRYSISSEAFVRVSVYDAGGRFITDLVNGSQAAGEHAARWDGTTASGESASSGVYFVRLQSAGDTRTRKIVLLK